MTTEAMIARTKTFLMDDPTATDAVVLVYLDIAHDAIMNTLYPFAVPEDATMPEKYQGLQCELAARYFARRGGLGETAHSENGVNRSWYSSDDRDILAKVTPFASVR